MLIRIFDLILNFDFSLRIRLEELSKFLKAAMENFSRPIQEDDYDALLETIYYLKEVRDRQYEIEDMFDPIKVIKII